MLRRNLVVILHEEQMSGVDVASISSPIPGGLGTDEFVPLVKFIVDDIKNIIPDYLKYGEQLKQRLVSIKKTVPTAFTKTGIVDFEIKTNGGENTKELPIYKNMYIINLCEDYKNVDCNTKLLPGQLNKEGLFIAPNTIIGLEFNYNRNTYNPEYEIVIRERI